MMLKLKMLVLKMVKKYIAKYIWIQIESFWQGWHKTSKEPYFYCGSSSRTISKSTKKSCQMLDVVRTYNNGNNKLIYFAICAR